MRLKKCLLTSLSLGLTGITIGAVVSSCASPTVQATDPNPASANSISTNPGDPLTPEQQDYQQKLAAEIKVQFDASAKLDYSNPTDKANIDSEITKYENELNSGEVGALISAYDKLDKNSKTFFQDFSNLYINFYDSFKQKNLIPNEAEINEYYKNNPPPSDITNWKLFAGNIALFYTDPQNIILLNQLLYKTTNNSLDLYSNKFFYFTDPAIYSILSFTKEYSNYDIGNIYKKLLMELESLKPEFTLPTNNSGALA